MRIVSVVVVIVVLSSSCSVKPEPLGYGTDICHACKMTLMDDKFGAELVTRKGKVYKFDDMRCLLEFYNSGVEPKDTYIHILVADYAGGGRLLDATQAFFVLSTEIRSPMDGQLAAFNSKPAMEIFNVRWKGDLKKWDELALQK